MYTEHHKKSPNIAVRTSYEYLNCITSHQNDQDSSLLSKRQ
jgi:hypothetical protein